MGSAERLPITKRGGSALVPPRAGDYNGLGMSFIGRKLRAPWIGALLAPAFLGAALLGACTVLPPVSDPVPEAASEALVEAQAYLRTNAPGRSALAREAARRAHGYAPDWVAPRRLLDDLDREDLLSVETLRAHLAALEEQPNDAGLHYLAGRLLGRDGGEHFRQALGLDPGLAWAHHGVAWEASAHGRFDRAVAREKAALSRARDTWERSYFTSALARFLAARGQRDEARALLQQRQTEDDVTPGDRVALGVQSVLLGLDTLERGARLAAYAEGLALLREAELTDAEVDRLVRRMRQVGSYEDGRELELLGALDMGGGAARDRWRAEVMLDRSPTPLALGLLERSFRERELMAPSGPLLRAARFAAAQFAPAVEAWLADLPGIVLQEEGLPSDPQLREVVHSVRRLAAEAQGSESPFGPPDRLAELGDALNDAGWFREARSVAGWLAASDLERGLAIERRALAGQELLESLRRLIYDMDLEPSQNVASASRRPNTSEDDRSTERSAVSSAGSAQPGRRIDDLDGLLTAMAPLFSRAHTALGGETDPERVRSALEHSPRLAYGPIGALIHPGPRFSETDQKVGRGTDGATVPGLAREMDRLSRFALVGQVLGGGGPDAAVLTRLEASRRSGEHLGVPWGGTVVWCEGADVLGRASRAGARISGAALHEGFWVDIDAVREDRAGWNALRRRFVTGDAEGDVARVERVLATRGLRIEPGSAKSKRQARRQTGALLDEGLRVRLAVLADRGEAGAEHLGLITLDELVDVTAVHEQGHLTDRSRFLPLGKNLGSALRLLIQAGLSPSGIVEQLEYRAQLIAMCSVDDPRIPLSQILDASELGLGGGTAHGAAYSDLLVDWIGVLGRAYDRAPEGWPELDPNHTLVHQLHWLGAERVREVSLALAQERGMVRD